MSDTESIVASPQPEVAHADVRSLSNSIPPWMRGALVIVGLVAGTGGGSMFGASKATEELKADVEELDDKLDAIIVAFARAHPTVPVESP